MNRVILLGLPNAPLKCISKLLTYILSTLRTGPQSYCDINYEMADVNQM